MPRKTRGAGKAAAPGAAGFNEAAARCRGKQDEVCPILHDPASLQ